MSETPLECAIRHTRAYLFEGKPLEDALQDLADNHNHTPQQSRSLLLDAFHHVAQNPDGDR